jgi:peroxin-1
MEACSRKIAMSPLVDLSEYATLTKGYSGADLQALVYNAHLDSVHSSILPPEVAPSSGVDNTNEEEERELAFATFGGEEKDEARILSRAEKAEVTKRVSTALSLFATGDLLTDWLVVGGHPKLAGRHARDRWK